MADVVLEQVYWWSYVWDGLWVHACLSFPVKGLSGTILQQGYRVLVCSLLKIIPKSNPPIYYCSHVHACVHAHAIGCVSSLSSSVLSLHLLKESLTTIFSCACMCTAMRPPSLPPTPFPFSNLGIDNKLVWHIL